VEDKEIPVPGTGAADQARLTLISTGTDSRSFRVNSQKSPPGRKYGQFPLSLAITMSAGRGFGRRCGPPMERPQGLQHGSAQRLICVGVNDAGLSLKAWLMSRRSSHTGLRGHNGVRRGKVAWGESVVVFGLGLVDSWPRAFALWPGPCGHRSGCRS